MKYRQCYFFYPFRGLVFHGCPLNNSNKVGTKDFIAFVRNTGNLHIDKTLHASTKTVIINSKLKLGKNSLEHNYFYCNNSYSSCGTQTKLFF